MDIYIAPIDQYIIDAVTAFRVKKEISQDGLAAILKVNKSFIGSIESSQYRAIYNIKHINAFSCYFNEPVASFLPNKGLPEKAIIKRKPMPLTENV